ncbi:hypothetical protein AKJ40_00185 [candidate division MSBL1 archaeon SCGC-AAA259M10]|uniref:4Fe-4S ferredoxin-type domain-containing protein n=4 Tax=candidate division MSBL1 TaxID=215777 RepID=A0A656YWV5_9EURY|nr:hypothetical protein AKJ66_00245 [candidate division MSBL1 archaeon SCGC-AAA259E22]KXA95430.1 hypothetical protein AKJ36_00585 [candidate division MSBL1 archaeon SCGC-AAA259I07]KXA98693.1 hypothetical protein AKJ39_01100 [candidate division MSBL1 archaeon SCGC-AAA259J03]KXB00889.1 hypothetical protein AKJ40_00185 [candidate division MSBL1 archaeon SCGC-AAA259M10]
MVILVIAGAIIGSVGSSGEGQGPGQEQGPGVGSSDFRVGLGYVLGVSIVAFAVMALTDFDNRIRVGLLFLTFFVFFFIKGGHLITLVPRLLGSEGVRAAAGEVDWRHFLRFSFPLAVAGLVLTLGATFFIGRALCGYGCPVGVFQELLYSVQDYREKARRFVLSTQWAFGVRLIVLGLIVVLYLGAGLDLVQVVSPYQLWRLEIAIPGIFVMIGFFVGAVFLYRLFCKLFCPFGALASLVAKFSILKIGKEESCTECGLCEKECPMQDCEKYGECYLCGRCARICQRESIGVS